MGTVIAVGGPPHSGKSVLLGELYRQLLSRNPHDVFLQPACPDGEGMFSREAPGKLVARLRKKGTYSDEWVAFALKSIRTAARAKRMLLVDLGGKLADDNRQVLALCSHIIVLSSAEDQIEPWREFAANCECRALALIRSAMVRRSDAELDMEARSEIRLDAEPIDGTLINLDRDAGSACYADAVDSLAGWIVARFLT